MKWTCPLCGETSLGEGEYSSQGYCQSDACLAERGDMARRGVERRPERDLAPFFPVSSFHIKREAGE